MAGWCRVYHHEVPADSWTTLENCRNTATSSVHGDIRSSAEPRALIVQAPALGLHYMASIFLNGRFRIDAGDRQARDGTMECFGEVRCGISRGEVHCMPAFGQGDRDGGSDGGLPDPALAHAHHEAVAVELHFVYQGSQRGVLHLGVRRGAVSDIGAGSGREQGLKRRNADHVARLQIQNVARKRGDRLGNGRDGGSLPCPQGLRQVLVPAASGRTPLTTTYPPPIPIWLSSK